MFKVTESGRARAKMQSWTSWFYIVASAVKGLGSPHGHRPSCAVGGQAPLTIQMVIVRVPQRMRGPGHSRRTTLPYPTHTHPA